MNDSIEEYTCVYIKDEPTSPTTTTSTIRNTKYEILDTTTKYKMNSTTTKELTKEQEKNVETILMSIKKESMMRMQDETRIKTTIDHQIDLDLLNKVQPEPIPILLRPPSSITTSSSLKSPPSMNDSTLNITNVSQLQQSIPIISIVNYNYNLTDPRIDYQHKHLQNQLKKLFVILSANNQQQIKFNNSICTNEQDYLKLTYDLTDLKNQVEYNLRTNLQKFSSQMFLIDYYDLNKQLEYVFIDLHRLQDKVCSNHVYLKDLYDFINELKINIAEKMRKFFKLQKLPELFQEILKQINVSRAIQQSPASPPANVIESPMIRDPRLRKQIQPQPQQQQQQQLTSPVVVNDRKYLLDLKIVKYNQSNETPKSPNSPKRQVTTSSSSSQSHKRVLLKQSSVSSIASVASTTSSTVTSTGSVASDFSDQIKQICDNIHQNILVNGDNGVQKKEKFMHEIINFIGTLLKKSTDDQKIEKESHHHHHHKRSHSRHSSSHSRKRNRSRSNGRHHSNRHHSDNRNKRSRSRSRSRSNRYHTNRSRSNSSKRSKETTSSGRTSTSSISTESPTTTTTKTKTSTTNNSTTTSTKIGLKIVYNQQQKEKSTTTTSSSKPPTPTIYNIENIPLPQSSPPIPKAKQQSFYI